MVGIYHHADPGLIRGDLELWGIGGNQIKYHYTSIEITVIRLTNESLARYGRFIGCKTKKRKEFKGSH